MIYEYQCKYCSYEFETFQNVSDKELKKCPECKKNKLVKLISGGCYTKIKKEPTTLGQIAEENSRKMGKELVEKTAREQGVWKEEKTPFFGKMPDSKIRQINNAKNEKERRQIVKRYIEKGD